MRLFETLTTFNFFWLMLNALMAVECWPDGGTIGQRKKERGANKVLHTKWLPKYLVKLYERSAKTLAGNVNMIRGVFPTKIIRTKRALKLVFSQDYLKNKESWKKDELRLYMNKAKGPLSSSTRPYLIRLFDLYSKKLINEYKLPTQKHGWQTIEVTGWRDMGEERIYHKRVGLKIIIQLGKKKLRIEHTPFRKSKLRREPYLVVFMHTRGNLRIDKEYRLEPFKRTYDEDPDDVLPFRRFNFQRHVRKPRKVTKDEERL